MQNNFCLPCRITGNANITDLVSSLKQEMSVYVTANGDSNGH